MQPFRHASELSGLKGLMRFAGDPLSRLENARRLHGTRVYYTQWRVPFALLMDPEAIETLLIDKAACVQKDRFTEQLGRVLGRGLVTSEGELWRRQRKLMAPSFQPRQIEGFSEVMVERTSSMIQGFHSGETRDIHADMMRLTLDIVVRTLFGSQIVRAHEVDEHLGAILHDFNALMFSWRAMFPAWTPFAPRRRLRRSRSQLQRIVAELIQQKRPEAASSRDLLSRLIAATDERGTGMSDEQLLDEAMTVFLAGHETTALALSYALCCLAQYPETRARLEQEVDEIAGTGPVTLPQVNRLAYCRAALRETMRLYPPVWAIGRSALRELEIAGTRFEPGTQFLMPQWIVHRDAEWFEAPLEFRPERWLSKECEQLPRFAYFPFGGGPRICIGNHFAMLEATLALATMVQHLRFELGSGFRLEFVPTVTLRPKGPILMRVERREHQEQRLSSYAS